MLSTLIDSMYGIGVKQLTALLAAVAAIATVLTLAMPVLSPDVLDKRMKSVALEREKIRQRERERLARGEKEKVSLRQSPKQYMARIVERFNLTKWLAQEAAREKLIQAGYRGQAPYIAFLFFRLITPVVMFLRKPSSLRYRLAMRNARVSFTGRLTTASTCSWPWLPPSATPLKLNSWVGFAVLSRIAPPLAPCPPPSPVPLEPIFPNCALPPVNVRSLIVTVAPAETLRRRSVRSGRAPIVVLPSPAPAIVRLVTVGAITSSPISCVAGSK